MTTLKLGDPAPDFALPADNGEIVRLADYRGKRVILYFYPKDDTPGCTAQACGFRDAYVQIEEKNAVVLGISPDDAKSHTRFKLKFNLPFRLLADENHVVTDLYGAWGEKSMYGKKYMGVIRSHVVIDENGNLADIQIKVSPSDSVEKALQALV